MFVLTISHVSHNNLLQLPLNVFLKIVDIVFLWVQSFNFWTCSTDIRIWRKLIYNDIQ